jgi:RimJ/RimL family protein N-acetyltransferase
MPSIHALELRTRGLVLTVPTDSEIEQLSRLVGEQGVVSEGDPYGDPWVTLEGEEQRKAFCEMTLEARSSLEKPGPFSIPLMGRLRNTRSIVGLFEIKSDKHPTVGLFPTTGRFDFISIVLKPHQGYGIAPLALVAVNTLMLDHARASISRADVWEENKPSWSFVERFGYKRTGSHVSQRQGYTQPTREYELVTDDWHGLPVRKLLSADVKGFDRFAAAFHPENEFRAFMALESEC